MSNVRLLDRPEDFIKLGVNPDKIEVWEDRRRVTSLEPNHCEWWYFDAILDEGQVLSIQQFRLCAVFIILPYILLPIIRIKGTKKRRQKFHLWDKLFFLFDTFTSPHGSFSLSCFLLFYLFLRPLRPDPHNRHLLLVADSQ